MKKRNVWGEVTIFRVVFIIYIMSVMAVLSALKIDSNLLLVFSLLLFGIFISSHTFIQRIKEKEIEKFYIQKQLEGKVDKDIMKRLKKFLVVQDIVGGLFFFGSLCVLVFLYLPSIDFKIGIYKGMGIFLVYSNALHYLIQIIFKRKLFGEAKKNIGFLLACILGAIVGVVFIVLE